MQALYVDTVLTLLFSLRIHSLRHEVKDFVFVCFCNHKTTFTLPFAARITERIFAGSIYILINSVIISTFLNICSKVLSTWLKPTKSFIVIVYKETGKCFDFVSSEILTAISIDSFLIFSLNTDTKSN